MKHDFLKQLKKLRVSKEANILLALSGGVDSMVLMHLLYALGLLILKKWLVKKKFNFSAKDLTLYNMQKIRKFLFKWQLES